MTQSHRSGVVAAKNGVGHDYTIMEYPEAGLQALQRVVGGHLIVSVPREPLWCALNLARGKYIADSGNTPGHIQHWSKSSFIRMVSKYFEVVEVKSPLPWTMLLCRPRG